MKINKQDIKLIFEFSPKDYFLVKSDDDEYSYTLNPRIDRSYKGKSDDYGVPKIFLTEEEGQQAIKEGFTQIL